MSRMKNKERRTLLMRVGAVLLAICMIAALALPALAADTSSDDTYSYTVRIFPGDKGTVDGGKEPIIRVVEPGYEWNSSDFDYGERAASDTDKYYVRGIREAGRDNNTTERFNDLIEPGFTITRDIDIVVAYGIKGSDVTYKINYVEYGTNKKLLEPRTYHGNIGDKPVVAYLYIDGYVPQYKNVTGKLDADSKKNEWTFYYVNANDASVAVNSKSTKTDSAATKSAESKSSKSSISTASVDSSSNGSATSTGSSTTTAGGTAAGSSTTTAGGTSTGSRTSTAGGTSTGTTTGSAASTANGTSGGSTTANGTTTGSSTSTASSSSTASTGTTAGSSSPLSVGEGTMLASNGAVNTLQNGPVEIVDVDEVETPLVEYDSADESVVESAKESEKESAVEENANELINRETEGVVRAKGLSGTAKVIFGAVIVMVIAAAGWFFLKKVSTQNEE